MPYLAEALEGGRTSILVAVADMDAPVGKDLALDKAARNSMM